MIDVSIIIVNYKVHEVIGECIQSVLMQEGVTDEIIVVDNGDAHPEVIKPYEGRIKIVWNGENLGFSKACNRGFQVSSGRYVLFLNPDARLQQKNDLKKNATIRS